MLLPFVPTKKMHTQPISTSILLLLFLFVVTLVAHSPSLNNQFAFDDLVHIVDNPSITTVSGTLESLLSPLFPGNLYRPLFTLSLALNYFLAELDPFIYHLTNVLLHVINVGFIFALGNLILSRRLALLGTLIFAVHPLHTEAVANVTGRSELLTHTFGLSYLWFSQTSILNNQTKTQQYRSYLVLTLLLFAALLCKESAAVYLPLTLALHYYRDSESIRRNCKLLLLPALLAIFSYASLRLMALGPDQFMGGSNLFVLDNPLQALPWHARVLSAISLLGRYLMLIVAPINLSADYSYRALVPLTEKPSLSSVILLCLTVGYFVLGVRFYLERKLQGPLILWFFISFMITSNIAFPIGTIFGERLAYLPSVGIIFYLIHLADQWRAKNIHYALVIAGFGIITAIHSTVWFSNETLFRYQIERSGQSAKTLSNLGSVFQKQGHLDVATKLFRESLEIMPSFDRPRIALAGIFINHKQFDLAEAELRILLGYYQNNAEALRLMGSLYLNQRKLRLAKRYYSRAKSIEPENLDTDTGLFGVALLERDAKTALKYYVRLKSSKCQTSNFLRLEKIFRGSLKIKD